MTVQALTREAGCYRGTFYYHYRYIEDFLDDVLGQLLNEELATTIAPVIAGQSGTPEIADAARRIEPYLDRIGLLLNSQIGRRLQPAIIQRVFTYWKELLGIELVEGAPNRGHAEFVIGGALAMWAWRARQPSPIPAQQLFSPAFVFSVRELLGALYGGADASQPAKLSSHNYGTGADRPRRI